MHVLVALSTSEFIAYADAARLLKHALGKDAPDLPALLGMEFVNRSAKTIAAEYLESHGHPSLRTCVRNRRRERRLATAKIPPQRKRILRSKQNVIPDDPSRN